MLTGENQSCQTIEAFLIKLSESTSPEEKLTLSLGFMSYSLTKDKVPYFKGFWQAKEKAFEALKAWPEAPLVIWSEYKELCSEFYRIKTTVDLLASSTAEHIELSLQSFESLINKILQGEELPPYSLIHFPGFGNRTNLEKLQGAFLTIHSLIEQLSAVRQEVLTGSMKMRLKNRLIASVNILIEKIIPLRKNIKNEVSSCFLLLVDDFIHIHFDETLKALRSTRIPFIHLQKEIKILHSLAQELALTGDGFKKSRILLTSCWQTLSTLHTQYKKKVLADKISLDNHKKEVASKIDSFRQAVKNQSVNALNKEDKKRAFIGNLKTSPLSREELSHCLEEVDRILKPLDTEEERARNLVIKTSNNLKAARDLIIEKLHGLIDVEGSKKAFLEAKELLETLHLTLQERIEIEPCYLDLKDSIERKESNSLEEERLRHEKILKQSSELKKIGTTFGGSDFEQALLYNKALKKHKERLQQSELLIKTFEEAIL